MTKEQKMYVNDKKNSEKSRKKKKCIDQKPKITKLLSARRNVGNAEDRKTWFEGMKNRQRERRKDTATLIQDMLSKEPFQLIQPSKEHIAQGRSASVDSR